jgi:hypothetical protein
MSVVSHLRSRAGRIHTLVGLRRGHVRVFAAVAATVMVAAFFAVACHVQANDATGRSGSLSGGTWQPIGQFQARQGEGVVVARSNPRAVYRLNHTTFVLERSGNGGGTWNTLALPAEVMQSPLKTYAVIDVSPLAANTVYLTAFGEASSRSCPNPFLPGGQGQRDFTCSLQYVSTTGGSDWQRLMLPGTNGRLTGMLTQVNGVPYAPLLPQEGRIYSLLTVDDLVGQYRLVASDDGVTWRTVDDDLLAQGQSIGGNVNYVATPTASTIWVRTSNDATWRSDDAGASWNLASGVPQDMTLAAAARAADGASLLYIQQGTAPFGDVAPGDVRVSADGGATWQPAPTRGIPDEQHAAFYSAMVRGDGALVMLFRTMELQIAFPEGMLTDAAFYGWKPGERAWTRLTPLFDAQAVEQRWLSLAEGGAPETIWGLIYRDDDITYEDNDNYIKDGVYTISGCALAQVARAGRGDRARWGHQLSARSPASRTSAPRPNKQPPGVGRVAWAHV